MLFAGASEALLALGRDPKRLGGVSLDDAARGSRGEGEKERGDGEAAWAKGPEGSG